jgi:hypothetical protein
MLNIQFFKKATLTAGIVGIVGLSSLMDTQVSSAATITIPLSINTFTLQGNTSIQTAPPDNQFNFFQSDYIFINGSGLATSQPSPFLPIKSKQTFLHFDYVFSQDTNSILELYLNNVTTGVSTLVNSLNASVGSSADINLSNLFITPGEYSITHQLSGGGYAGFNNFALKISVPEPTTTLGLIVLGISAFTLKRKSKVSVSLTFK